MSWGYRISMQMKLFIALFPLLLALVWFAGSGIVSRINTEQQMNTIGQLTTLARSAGDVVHQLQSERGMSAGFIGARGQKFRDDLAAQRQLTDKVLATFKRLLTDTNKDLLQGNIAAPLKTFNESIQFLDSTRTAISELTIDSPKASQFYTQTISDVLKFVGGMGHLSTSGSMVNELAAYYSLLNLKEQAGVERALLSNIFSMDRFDDGQFSMFSDVVGQQDAWLTAARSFSTPVQAAELDKSLQSAEATRALELRETAFNKAAEGGFGVNPTDWFNLQTQRIETLRKVENRAVDALQEHAALLAHNARVDWQSFLVISLVALLIAIAFAVMVARSIQQQLNGTLKTIAEMDGDLTRRLDVPGSDELSALNRAYNQAIENIQHIVQEIKSGAVVLRSASSDIAAGNQDLAQRTDEQAASIVETAASMEQISTAITQTADNASEAERLIHSMERDVLEANRVSNEASQSMAEIRSSSEQISQIVASIDEISFQTNLLALNAAVEAARAGELGKGFAVVATEVRNLSQRCAREASQIRELINQNMDKIGEGVARVTASGTALKAAAENTGRMKQYVSDIARAANEQSLGVSQVHQALNQLEQVTQQNAALVSQAASASQMLDGQSEAMSTLVDRFIV
ncbi:HAMP domain-containing protein [Salmonella enterica]|uniref:Methyl-accepting chemotaxis protein n=8 Tax=Enterobacteriaceae TaxID=543 RepID=A0A5X9Y971_SALET|nr:methyl-accepting chemotaxis protein [Salmonella enterica]EAA9985623.1 methyl-accepting chemotaxis protein [Salmonella enterica subsp. enterica serovar Adelaide]EAC1981302.1 methyl-accepting chemotaxis protein [Salmonella enterica subsp. enterica serovar Johannesburg]EAO5639966.1 HAMP domain-containing protein [Salmonella enterica subsp. enterica serovar Alachua]EAQ9302545.1 HAMP domain-containing protein [Salmonella enterica subsp. enterica serovar Uganda]EAX7867387.1 HAMP domain-containing